MVVRYLHKRVLKTILIVLDHYVLKYLGWVITVIIDLPRDIVFIDWSWVLLCMRRVASHTSISNKKQSADVSTHRHKDILQTNRPCQGTGNENWWRCLLRVVDPNSTVFVRKTFFLSLANRQSKGANQRLLVGSISMSVSHWGQEDQKFLA